MAQLLPRPITRVQTGLSAADHALLRKKQRWLEDHIIQIPRNSSVLQAAADATLVFAQDCAGTAVCMDARGLVLTCSHCIAESEEEYLDGQANGAVQWLIFASGRIVQTQCVAWDEKLDLALLKVIQAQPEAPTASAEVMSSSKEGQQAGTRDHPISLEESFEEIEDLSTFPAIQRLDLETSLVRNTRLICIGHPGSEDLESETPGTKTNYDVLHVSEGKFRGYAEGQSVYNNSEIGALMHDCWTYWGHSGAPLVERVSGKLVGLHSSWDDETGMRRGIGAEAIAHFLRDHGFPDVA